MKLLQLNTWMGKLNLLITRFLEAERPDILCLQEVFSSPDGEILVPDIFGGLEILTKATGHQHCFFAPTWSNTYGGATVHFGTAIISKFPLLDQETIFINGSYDPHPAQKLESINNRHLQLARVEADGTSFTIANQHAYWQPDPLGNQTTIDSMAKVKARLESVQTPLIFAGDLNITSDSPAMRVFDDFLEDLTATHHLQTTLTSLAKVPNVACDHILISPDIRVQNFHASKALVSDHAPLVLEFEV